MNGEPCSARCGGIEGHSGFHQTIDYDDIRQEARRLALAEVEEKVWGLQNDSPSVAEARGWGRHYDAVLAAIEEARKP